MKKLGIAAALAVVSVLAVASFAFATGGDGGGGSFHAKLNGYNEVPSISTAGRGNFQALVRFEDDHATSSRTGASRAATCCSRTSTSGRSM